jgi:polysaccharide pyruvyl transferase WcaK-like protein
MLNIFSIRPKGFNIGNEVIYLGVNHFIRLTFKQNYNVISLPATNKYETHKKAGLSSQTVYEINQYGHGVIVGGGNLYENGELEINPVALKALEKPMMIFSVSRGRIYNSKKILVDRTDVMDDSKIKLINDHCITSISRDKATYEYLKKINVNSIIGGCPTLFINEIPQHLVPLLEADKTDALISIRNPYLMNIPVDFQYEMRYQLISLIELLRKKGYQNIKFLCHDHRDIPFAASFKGIDYLYTEDVYTYLTYLRNTRLNVTYRLHSLLPCLSYNIPVIKISYDERAISMLETINMNEWNINLIHQDVVTEVEKRIDSLGDLDTMKKNSYSHWQNLRELILKECEKFANKVLNQFK